MYINFSHWFNIIKKITFSLLLGFILTLLILQRQDRFKKIIKQKIQLFLQNSYNCEIDFEVSNISVFFPSIQLSDFIIKESQNEDWNWKCKTLKFSCSWLDFIFRKKFYSSIEIDNFEAYSVYKNGNLAILPHLKQLFVVDPDFPMVLKNAYMNNSSVFLYEPDLKLKGYFNWSSHSKLVNNDFKTNIYFNDGYFEKDGSNYLNNLSGSLQVSLPSDAKNSSVLIYDLLCNCNVLNILDKRCFLQGKFQDGSASFKAGTIDGQIIASSTITSIQNKLTTKINLNTPLSCLFKVAQIDFPYEGICSISLDLDINNWQESLHGSCHITDLFNRNYPNFKINECKILFNKKNSITKGTLILAHAGYEFLGNWSWKDKLKSGQLYLDNSSILSFSNQYPWIIDTKDFSIKFNLNKDFKLDADFKFKVKNQKLEKSTSCRGKIDYFNNVFNLKGNFENNLFQLSCNLKPFIINNFLLKDEAGKECISIQSNLENKPYSTSCLIYYQNIKNWFVDSLNPFLNGEGLIKIDGNFNDNGFMGQINLSQGSLKVINIQNIIKEINGSLELNTKEKSLVVNDLILNLSKGSIECKKGVIIVDDPGRALETSFMHFPLILKNCFVNWKNDFFARLGGRILTQKKLHSNISIDGNLIIYNSQIKDNIFSKDFSKEFFFGESGQTLFPVDINLSVINKNPIKIKTPFFESRANLNLDITKTILNPEISGQIELVGGSINFPYKPLNIVSGSVNFIKDSKDPIINLVARNKIQKFTVTMQIMGSVNDPKIVLESSPVLSDEQIGALLLAGSEKASLNLVMPTLLLQNIKNIILGSSNTYSKVEKYIQKFLKPFKNVRILPTFTDDKGGGFQGTIEVDLSDRLSANLQKNFSSSEDTKLEVDYTLTDDVSLRGIKDEQGNLGGELEVRWKL